MEAEIPKRARAPLSLRTDSVGIFAVLGISGISQIIGGPPNSVQEAVEPIGQLLWAWTLAVAGIVGLGGTLTPSRWQIIGFAIEAVARLALGLGSLAYALALWAALGWNQAEFTILIFTGLSVMLLVGALQIVRWLRWQRAAVTVVMQHRRDEEIE